MATSYSKSSLYYATEVVNNYLDVLTIRDFPYQTDDIVFEITSTYDKRPDLLAYDLYKDSRLWWVFAVRNRTILKDPIYDMQAGTKIYLPKLSTLKSSLGI